MGSLSKQRLHFAQTLDQRVDFGAHVVERERRASRRGHAKMIHYRHRAVMSRSNCDAPVVENRADLMRVYTFERERQNAGLVARRTKLRQSGQFVGATSREIEQAVRVSSERIQPEPLDVIA